MLIQNTSQNSKTNHASPITSLTLRIKEYKEYLRVLWLQELDSCKNPSPSLMQDKTRASPVSTVPSSPLQCVTSMSNVEPSRCGHHHLVILQILEKLLHLILLYTSFLNVPQLSFSSTLLGAFGASFNSPCIMTRRTAVTDAAGQGVVAKYH